MLKVICDLLLLSTRLFRDDHVCVHDVPASVEGNTINVLEISPRLLGGWGERGVELCFLLLFASDWLNSGRISGILYM